MTLAGSSLGESSRIFRSARNNAAVDLLEGAAVQMDRSDIVALSIKLGEEPGLLAEFGGILSKELATNALGDENSSVRVIEGLTKVRFKGHASALVGTWARLVTGQSYMTYSAYPTGIMLQTDMSADTDVHEVDDTIAATVYIMPGVVEKGSGSIHDIWEGPVVLDVDRILEDEASAVTPTTVTTFAAQPDTPRNLIITPTGTTADVAAGDVVVTGTNVLDEVITESFTFLANASTVTVGAKAFKSVTSILIHAQDGAGATWDVGVGDELGLSRVMENAPPVVEAALGTTLEGTSPTVTGGPTIEESTVNLNSAHNGTQVNLWMTV